MVRERVSDWIDETTSSGAILWNILKHRRDQGQARSKHRPIRRRLKACLLASEVFPTPGGPMKQRMGALDPDPRSLMTAMCSTTLEKGKFGMDGLTCVCLRAVLKRVRKSREFAQNGCRLEWENLLNSSQILHALPSCLSLILSRPWCWLSNTSRACLSVNGTPAWDEAGGAEDGPAEEEESPAVDRCCPWEASAAACNDVRHQGSSERTSR